MIKEFDPADVAAARSFFARLNPEDGGLLRMTMRGCFVFQPASEAIGHHSTVIADYLGKSA